MCCSQGRRCHLFLAQGPCRCPPRRRHSRGGRAQRHHGCRQQQTAVYMSILLWACRRCCFQVNPCRHQLCQRNEATPHGTSGKPRREKSVVCFATSTLTRITLAPRCTASAPNTQARISLGTKGLVENHQKSDSTARHRLLLPSCSQVRPGRRRRHPQRSQHSHPC